MAARSWQRVTCGSPAGSGRRQGGPAHPRPRRLGRGARGAMGRARAQRLGQDHPAARGRHATAAHPWDRRGARGTTTGAPTPGRFGPGWRSSPRPSCAAFGRPQCARRRAHRSLRRLEPWWHHYDPSDHARADGLLEEAGLGRVSSQEFGVLSEGERQQVLLARALMGDPSSCCWTSPPPASTSAPGSGSWRAWRPWPPTPTPFPLCS